MLKPWHYTFRELGSMTLERQPICKNVNEVNYNLFHIFCPCPANIFSASLLKKRASPILDMHTSNQIVDRYFRYSERTW